MTPIRYTTFLKSGVRIHLHTFKCFPTVFSSVFNERCYKKIDNAMGDRKLVSASIIVLMVVCVDLGTKDWAKQNFKHYTPSTIFNEFLAAKVTYNNALALNIMSPGPGRVGFWSVVFMLHTTSVGVVVGLLHIAMRYSYRFYIPVAVLAGGALGNFVDRATCGAVTDFIVVHYHHFFFPTINIADIAITFSGLIVAYRMLRYNDGLFWLPSHVVSIAK